MLSLLLLIQFRSNDNYTKQRQFTEKKEKKREKKEKKKEK